MSVLQRLVDEAEGITAWSDRATIERIYRSLADSIPDSIGSAHPALLGRARATRDRLHELLQATSPPVPRQPSLEQRLPPCACGCRVMLVKDRAIIADLATIFVACKQCRAVRVYLHDDARLGMREITVEQEAPSIYR